MILVSLFIASLPKTLWWDSFIVRSTSSHTANCTPTAASISMSHPTSPSPMSRSPHVSWESSVPMAGELWQGHVIFNMPIGLPRLWNKYSTVYYMRFSIMCSIFWQVPHSILIRPDQHRDLQVYGTLCCSRHSPLVWGKSSVGWYSATGSLQPNSGLSECTFIGTCLTGPLLIIVQ